MNKKIWIGVLVVAVVALFAWFYTSMNQGQAPYAPQANATSTGTQNQTSTTSNPTPSVAGPNQHCGGNMMNAPVCGTGYYCAPDPGSHLPFGDVGGTCQPIVNGGKG